MDIEQGGDYEFSDPIDAFLSLNGAFQGVKIQKRSFETWKTTCALA
jgi:hypothetical protein